MKVLTQEELYDLLFSGIFSRDSAETSVEEKAEQAVEPEEISLDQKYVTVAGFEVKLYTMNSQDTEYPVLGEFKDENDVWIPAQWSVFGLAKIYPELNLVKPEPQELEGLKIGDSVYGLPNRVGHCFIYKVTDISNDGALLTIEGNGQIFKVDWDGYLHEIGKEQIIFRSEKRALASISK